MTLAVLIALREKNLIYPAIAGAIFISSVFIRYTNMLMIIPILTIFIINRPFTYSLKQKFLAFSVTSSIGIISLLVYQQFVFSDPFSPSYSNSILGLISLNNFATGIQFYSTVLINGLSMGGIVLILFSLLITAIHRRRIFIIIISWILPFVIFYASYDVRYANSTDLNFRFLLPILPALFIGVAVALDWALNNRRKIAIPITLLMLLFITVVTYPQVKTVEENLIVYPGITAINNVSELANAIPRNSIVFVDGIWNSANNIQAVIKFEKNSTVISLPLTKGKLRPLIDTAIAEKGEAWLLINSNSNYISDLRGGGLLFQTYQHVQFNLHR